MKSILLFTLLFAVPISWSQEDSTRIAEVRAVIDQLFEGMELGDSTMVREVFHSDAKAYTSFQHDGTFNLHEGLVDRFVEAVGTPHDEVWDEQISNVLIRVDDGLAQAWMDYSFFLGGEFSHKGVNTMLLAHVDGQWKIVNLADTRRKK
ncbi:MAG: nuclear transport factor 2 family protein [Crocinitomicaceae bacterium]